MAGRREADGPRPPGARLSRALGHASISTTANTYGHFTKAMAERSAERMGAVLGEPASD